MSSAFDAEVESAASLFSDTFGEEVTLHRASDSTSAVSAQWVEQGAEIQTQTRMGAKTSFIDRCWVIAKEDYVIDSVAVTPAAGDRLVDSDSVTWEVMAQQNAPAAESYAGGLEWLLKTKRIASS